jgi:hypothetical protein
MIIKKAWLLGIVFLTVIAALAPSVMAQESAAKGSLNGTVVDSTGGVIVGAETTLTGQQGNQSQVTNGLGNFAYQNLIPGTYKLGVTMKGFRHAEAQGIAINVGRVSTIRIQLEPGSVTSTVEVVSPLLVDTTSTAVATNLNDDFCQKLPLQRGIAGLVYLAPGVVSGGGTGASNPSISGASGLENLYIADGVSITDTAFGGFGVYSRVYGSLGTGISLTFIKEVQVKTGSIEPQYGGATGGVVQIVTKSGGNQYHGAFGGYWQPNALEAARINPDNFGLANPFGILIHNSTAEVYGELGGPVPGLKNKLFFFGSFDPIRLESTQRAPPDDGIAALGNITLRTWSYNYAAKLTFRLNDKNTIEGSVFGDPSYWNTAPWYSLSEAPRGFPNTTSFSKASFGNRNAVVRYNGTLSQTWVVNLDLTWQNNHFKESGYDKSVSAIIDQTQTAAGPPGGNGIAPGVQQGQFFAVGRGYVENTEDNSYGVHINTSKILNFWGQHAFDIGYGYNRPFYKGVRASSGPALTPPQANEDGTLPSSQCNVIGAVTNCPWTGLNSNYIWHLLPISAVDSQASCLSCPVMNVAGVGPEPVLLNAFGEFPVDANGTKPFSTTGRNHSAYVNDSWTINKYVTLNAGLRWQQERLIGDSDNYTFTDNWSPSLGVTIDPLGDWKNKIWLSFSRYNYNFPLDLANRALSFYQYIVNIALAPAYNIAGTNGCTPTVIGANTYDRCVALNSFGTVTPIVDAAHDLNNSVNGIPFGEAGSGNMGEPIHTGTRLTYEDEYVIGAEHEFSHGVILTARYMHRSLRRIVEDTSGLSPESANAGLVQQFSITNPAKNTDIFTNPIEVDYNHANGLPAACAPGNFNIFPINNSLGIPQTDSSGNNAACFKEVVTNDLGAVPVGVHGCQVDASGNSVPGHCTAAGSVVPDGIPDGFADPIRKYWSVVIEVNKSFSHNWQLRANYTLSRVFGNYEGAYRNDNGQGDPGISSLFDFTPGNFGLLGTQVQPGVLNENRQEVANGYFSYLFDRGMLKNLTLGTGVNISTGTPITAFAAHPVYQNPGEVPLGSRGSQGTTPTTGTVNFHGDYFLNVTEKMHLRFGVDLFNIANTKRILYFNQNVDLGTGVPNADFLKPANIGGIPISASSGIQSPFNARLSFSLEF